MCARLCCAVAWVTCVVWGNVLSGVPCMTGCGALRAPRNLHATHTTMSVRGTRQQPFPACDACYELKQTELPGLPWSLASGDYAYYFQDAVPSRFLAWTGGGMDWLRSHQLLRYLTIRLTREGGIVANRTAMDPLQVLDNDTFSPIHILPIPSFSPRGQSPLGQSPGGGATPKKNPGSKQ